MDRVLSDYQFYFIFGSYGVFFVFFLGLTLYYIVQFRYYTKAMARLVVNPVHSLRQHHNDR